MSLSKSYINPARGYTNVVATDSAGVRTILVSGQVGLEEGSREAPSDLGEQAKIAWTNLKTQLAAAGATPDDVVKLNVYIKDLDPDSVRAVGKAQAANFPTEKPPAATWVGVTSLVFPSLAVEIEATAVVPANGD